MKRRFIFNLDTINENNWDENLEKIITRLKFDISNGILYDFETTITIDNFVENYEVTNVINTFLHDICNKESGIYIIERADCINLVKSFIIGLSNNDSNNKYEIGCKFHDNSSINWYCNIPNDLFSDEEYNKLIAFQGDYVKGNFSLENIIRYILPTMYRKLAKCNFLDDAHNRTIGNIFFYIHF